MAWVFGRFNLDNKKKKEEQTLFVLQGVFENEARLNAQISENGLSHSSGVWMRYHL